MSRTWIGLAALALACEPNLPDGRLACTVDSECPPGFVCAASRCYRLGNAPDGGRDAGTDSGVDGGPDDAGIDAGPPPVPVQIAAGFDHACARMMDGTLRCWGGNSRGQLGDGTILDRLTPVPVMGAPSEVVIVVAGSMGTCLRTLAGEMYCWGANDQGGVGDGTTEPRTTPTRVLLPGPATFIERGWSHSCAVVGGQVYCWGTHEFLGLQGATAPVLTPTLMAMPETALRVSASGPTVVIGSTGVWAWGRNTSGQLGDGTLEDRALPVAVTGIAAGTADFPSAGGFHACVSLADDTLACWGHNPEGQVGNGTIVTPVTSASVVDLDGVMAFDAGHQHTCAVRNTGTVWCWGRNDEGEIGDGTRSHRSLPTEVIGLTGVTRISAGRFFSCALSGSEVYCWGDNARGQLGDGTTTDSTVPVRVLF